MTNAGETTQSHGSTAYKIATSPVSWGVLEFQTNIKKSYQQVLTEMADAGYAGTELGEFGFLPTDPAVLRDTLAQDKLALVSGWVAVPLSKPDLYAGGEAYALKVAKLLTDSAGKDALLVLSDEVGGDPVRTRNAGRIRPEMSLKPDGWKVFADAAMRIARAVRDQTGLRTVFHNHSAGFVATPAEVETLMNMTDPALLGLCLDTGHYAFSSGDPLQALRHYRDRIWHIHLKDFDPSIGEITDHSGDDYYTSLEAGIFCELGQGEVDFPRIVKELKAAYYSGWIVVEQDVLPGMGTPLDSAKRNRDYLKSLGL